MTGTAGGGGSKNATLPFLEIRSLRHDYRQPDGSLLQVLRLDSLRAFRGEALAVVGPSGSGKTTLLHILAALVRPTGGEVLFEGRSLNAPCPSGARWRALSVGYVFQDVNLLPDFSVLENLLLAAEISGVPRAAARERALSLLRRLGIEGRGHNRPAKLSLGEQQRAAVARAVIHAPPLVLADEPTASLDAENARIVTDLLLELCEESRSLLVTATHDEAVKKRFRRFVAL
ncbi:MAG: ABC transporter ATP-binding protein [Synergistaceae bacterium]|jgi:ABC-type lipoprotein export system ATPase subunit|nr:ABC transporter ATP-binding protein [Synergistaceae bacterium]